MNRDALSYLAYTKQTRPTGKTLAKQLGTTAFGVKTPIVPSLDVLIRWGSRKETAECLQYCERHFVRCSEGRCRAPANHTMYDGARFCHKHARGIKECYPSSILMKEGYSVGLEV